ncbi:hypothetical protein Lal_00045753 [Lupinus albus]|nr:hypothetical protein Lal_00045753 [Lupinus albus]
MFNSQEFKKSKFYGQKNGATLEAKKIVLGHELWSRATDIIKVFELIVKVLSFFFLEIKTFDTPQAAWSRMNISSDDGDNDKGNVEAGENDDEGEEMQNDPYEEMSLHRRDYNLIDLTMIDQV